MTAYPAAAYVFDHWEGDLNGAINPAAIILDSDKSVTAVFVESSARHTITSDAASPGGKLVFQPVQPLDGYPINTRVTVTAIADSGYVFSHFEGDANGPVNPVSITADRDKGVTAFFKPTVHTTVSPSGAGAVNLDPDWVLSGYPLGAKVTMTAIPAEGYRFDHWIGDLTGSANPTTTAVESPKNVTAVFVEQQSSTFTWWWIVLGIFLLSLALIALRIVHRMMSRNPTEDEF